MRGIASSVAWRVGLVLLCVGPSVGAEPVGVKAQMAEVLRYTGLERPADEDVARMAEFWTRAQEKGVTADDRRAAFRDMFALYAKLHGRDLSGTPRAMDGIARFATGIVEGGGRMDLRLPAPRGTPSGSYLHVETRGTGPIPLLLISDLGVDGRKLYASFARRQHQAYTMHIVTLPWAGAARPLPWPERLDFAARPWLTWIEQELLAILDRPGMNGVTVIGTSAGGYFAARLGLERPKQIRAVVLAHALVRSPMRSLSDPDRPASMEERLARLTSVTPTPQLFPYAAPPTADELRRLIADPASTHPTARNWMAFAVKDASVSREWTFEALSGGFFVPSSEYMFEMLSTDLTGPLGDLSVPMLAMGTWHDEGSPVQSPPNLSQWEEMRLRHPDIPLSVVSFDDTRAYVSADAPEEFDRALADFLAGRAVRGKIGYHLPRTSSRATIMQSVAGTDVRISFGRPAVKGRKIWGALVPLNRVWRAGANEATTFSVTRDVLVEGRPLAAGTYTLFVVPTGGDWTLILNRVPRQWGAFDYDPAFDALRVGLTPIDGAHEEHLSYRVEPDGPNRAAVTLAWETRRLTFRVEVKAR
jgi:pimeloyl-ACP methyl ester carboxylesterase